MYNYHSYFTTYICDTWNKYILNKNSNALMYIIHIANRYWQRNSKNCHLEKASVKFTQRCCHPWAIVKSDVLWGIMVENASCSLLTPHCNESISQVTSPGYACRLWHLGDGSVVSSVWRQLRAHILTVPPVGESLACLLLKLVFVSWQFIIMFCNFYVYYKYPFVF